MSNQVDKPIHVNDESNLSQQSDRQNSDQSDDDSDENTIPVKPQQNFQLQNMKIVSDNSNQINSIQQICQNINTQKADIIKKIKKYQEMTKTSIKDKRAKILEMRNFKAQNEVQCQEHIKQEVKQGKLKCPDCSATLCNKYSLNRHIVNKHKATAKRMGLVKFYCDLCKQSMYKTIEKYKKHVKQCLEDYMNYNIAAKNINQSDIEMQEPQLIEQELLEYEEAINMNI